MVSVLDLIVSKKSLLLLLLDAGTQRSLCGVLSWERQGCACHWATLRMCRCCVEGACVRSVLVREQPLRMCSAWACGLCAQCCVYGGTLTAPDGYARRERDRRRNPRAMPGHGEPRRERWDVEHVRE